MLRAPQQVPALFVGPHVVSRHTQDVDVGSHVVALHSADSVIVHVSHVALTLGFDRDAASHWLKRNGEGEATRTTTSAGAPTVEQTTPRYNHGVRQTSCETLHTHINQTSIAKQGH